MLSISGVTKAYGGRTLFEGASLQIERGDRIGLVGPNGAGKSTLLSIILEKEPLDAGKIDFQRGMNIGYLPQEMISASGQTVLQLATSSSGEIAEMDHRIGNDSPGTGAAAHEVELPAYELEPKAKKILRGLAFRESDFDRPCSHMSGGWIMRAHLARLLVHEPDLLMLDEPTNHLDLDALLWFQSYLKQYKGAILFISHDRDFLNQLADRIVEIRHSRLWQYRGNYDEYLQQREAQEEQLHAAYKNQQREIAHLMRFVDRFRAKNTKASQAQSKLKQIERMEMIDAPAGEDPDIDFRFPQPARSGLRVIKLSGIHHAYGDAVVYQGVDFQAERGQRIVLVGPNGSGKSTLLKILAGVVQFQSGQRQLGHNVRLGYFAQHRVENLNLDHTVLEEALDTPQLVGEQFARTVLGCFLFRGDDVFKKVRVLSGGEKSRLALVKLLLDPPNLLLMDEPTTHLDLASVEALVAALEQFEGTLIFISHDVYFIRALANHVVQVNAGQLRHFSGDYQYYIEKTAAERSSLALDQTSTVESSDAERPAAKAREQKRVEAEQRQARYRVRKAQQQIVEKIEREIAQLEETQRTLTTALESPETYQQQGRAAEVTRELAAVVGRLKQLSSDWDHAASKLAELEHAQ
jgi:ATP-binding cassette, subfamily F, member 3